MMTTERAFTLVELVVALAVLAILAALAAPSFRGLIDRWQHRSAVNTLQSAMGFALHEALRRNYGNDLSLTSDNPHRLRMVAMCAGGSDGCDPAGDWNRGVLIFADASRDCRLDDGEAVLRVLTLPRVSVAGPSCIGFTREPGITDAAGRTTLQPAVLRLERADQCARLEVRISGRPRARPCT